MIPRQEHERAIQELTKSYELKLGDQASTEAHAVVELSDVNGVKDALAAAEDSLRGAAERIAELEALLESNRQEGDAKLSALQGALETETKRAAELEALLELATSNAPAASAAPAEAEAAAPAAPLALENADVSTVKVPPATPATEAVKPSDGAGAPAPAAADPKKEDPKRGKR
jgi:hypothetical protein